MNKEEKRKGKRQFLQHQMKYLCKMSETAAVKSGRKGVLDPIRVTHPYLSPPAIRAKYVAGPKN